MVIAHNCLLVSLIVPLNFIMVKVLGSNLSLIIIENYVLFIYLLCSRYVKSQNRLTWLTAGGILAKERISSSLLLEKLLTPIALVRPRVLHSSIHSQTALISMGNIYSLEYGKLFASWLNFIGQCIKKRSRYSSWRFLHANPS